MTARRAALVFLALTALVMAFHLALILGAPWGRLTSGGRWPGVLPVQGRAVSLLSIAALVLVARAVAERAGLVWAWLPAWAFSVTLVWLTLGAVLNGVTPSAMERGVWLPVILVMLACALRIRRASANDFPSKNQAQDAKRRGAGEG